LNERNPPTTQTVPGVTGFLGAFLLHDLLSTYETAKVYCLVRAKDDAEALGRVLDNMKAHLLAMDESFTTRVVALQGDLAEPQFGFSAALWSEMCEKIDVIVHNGALVHWVLPYEQLKPANVAGTVQALRLACGGGKTKPLHFVSSTSVLDTQSYVDRDAPVREDDSLDDAASGLVVGYGQSKWVAERILMLARERGMPITVLRPGYILGHSATGVCESDDFLWRLLKGCVELQLCPKMRNRVNAVCVDYVSALLVSLVGTPSAIGKCFHTVNPTVFRFDDFFDIARSYGWNMEPTDYLVWRDKLEEYTMRDEDSALFPLLHYVVSDLPTKSRAPRLDNANTLWLHENSPSPLRCPSMAQVPPALTTSLSFAFPLPPLRFL
jgi:L-aminoadipate-semialdehyde dehydrogenase